MATVLVAFLAPKALADELESARHERYERYSAELEQLAHWCAEKGLADSAALTEHWLPPREGDKLYIFLPDATAPLSESPADLDEGYSALWRQWRDRFLTARRAQAEALFDLARRAVAADKPSLGQLLLAEVLREDPAHEAARKALGYTRHDDRWRTPYEARMLDTGHVWHDRFGWLKTADVARYERGERLAGRWVSAEEDARLHRDISRGWKIETEHFEVTTNHSLEAGVELAKRLERLHAVWRQIFAAYYTTRSDLKRILDGRPPARGASPRHRVVCFRSRDEYNDALRSVQPKIDITLGIYFDDRKTSYFFVGEEQSDTTVVHEATHQLFQESRRTAKNVGRASNFWIIEGIATYFESLAEHEDYVTLGGSDAGRLPAARERLLSDGFYVPFAELTRLGMHDLQGRADIARVYSQCAGQATFLMHADSGRYRDALVAYLEAVYSSKAEPDTLARLTGKSYDALDREYRNFLER